MNFIEADCEHIAVENPKGIMNTANRKPDQIIDPYMFAESSADKDNYVTKATCLWLKGLPTLKTNGLPKPDNKALYGLKPSGKNNCWTEAQKGRDRKKERSKTFPGIAEAMAQQWGDYINGM